MALDEQGTLHGIESGRDIQRGRLIRMATQKFRIPVGRDGVHIDNAEIVLLLHKKSRRRQTPTAGNHTPVFISNYTRLPTGTLCFVLTCHGDS